MYQAEVASQSVKFSKWDKWSKWVLFLLLGYAITGRSFSYLGIPPAKLFIGDLTLAAFIFLGPRKLFDRWIKALTTGGALGPFAWVLLASVGYGIFEVIRGILAGFSPITAIENLVFNIYPLYLFLGIWVGIRRPELLLKYFQLYAICFCIYAPAYFLFLHTVDVQMPGSDGITVFGQAAGGGFIILALLCLDPKPSRFWFPMTMAGIALLAAQVRAEWLGMGFALMIWGVLARKMGRVAVISAGMLALLVVGFALDVNIPSPAERGGAISSREIVARGISAASPELARDLTGSENTGFYSGTIKWRQTWWRAIREHSNENYTMLLIGPGYGYLLRNLVNYLKDLGEIRTPHNVFFYALGYSGWVGVVLFFSLQATVGSLVWRVYRLTGQPFGLAFWAAALLSAFFGNVMETPAGAIPFYLTLGLIIGPTLSLARAYPVRQEVFHLDPSPVTYTTEAVYTPEGV